MTNKDIYDTLISGTYIVYISNPYEKGKPFERMGHKALEPKSLKRLMVVSCQNGKMA